MFPLPRGPAAGLIQVVSLAAEPPRDVAARIREILKSVRPEKLWINPQGGCFETSRWIGGAKLRAMVAGARIVRKGLGGA